MCRTPVAGKTILALCLLLASDMLMAQALPPPTSSNSPQLDDIIVTAQKREQSVNDVGLTISAFSGDALELKGVTDVADLAKVVPGFTAATTPLGPPVFSLRGVGFYDSTLSAAPAVTVYVDEVPLPYPAMTSGAMLDLQRVEVLKGPQGILFGENSTGGAINYIAAKPTDHLEAGFDVDYGRFNLVDTREFVSGPVSDTVKMRFALSTTNQGDWQYSYTRNDYLGAKKFYSARLLTDWTPTDRLKVALDVTGWIDNSDSPATQYYALVPQLPSGLDPALAAYPFAPSNPRAADWTPGQNYARDYRFWQTSVRTDFDINSDLRLTSISAYEVYKQNAYLDNSGITLVNDNNYIAGGINSTFQELRIANSASNRARWVVGANFSHDNSTDGAIGYNDDASNAGALPLKETHVGFKSQQEATTEAVFSNIEFDVLPAVTAKAGIRYTENRRDFAGCSKDTGDGQPFNAAPAFNELWSLLKGSPVTPTILPGGCLTLINTIDYIPGLVTSRLDEHNIPWRAGVDWKARSDMLLYFNVSRGYKAGGYPTSSAATYVQYKPVPQESVLAYEGGIKTTLFDRLVDINAAGFYYDYTDKQIRGFIADPIFGSLEALVSVPKSDVEGGEFSVNVHPIAGLTLNLSGTYIEATIKELTNYNSFNKLTNFNDTPMPYAPRLQFSAGADYTWPLSGNLSAFFGSDLLHHSGTFATIGAEPLFAIKGYTTLDLRTGVQSNDGRWRLSIWGRNVTDEYYWDNASRLIDTVVRFPAMPATFGLTLSLRLK